VTDACFSTHIIHAQENITEVADRTLEVTEALANAEWQQLNDGMHLKQVTSNSGVLATAFRFEVEKYSLELAIQNHPKGERAHQIAERLEAMFVVNGGFFGIDSQNRLFPVGALSVEGMRKGMAWRKSGGYFNLDDEPAITPTRSGVPAGSSNFLQSKPVLIEAGGAWAMNTNSKIQKRRTMVCLPRDGSIVIVMITGSGMSLFEAGWLLRSNEFGGHFDCDAAIAMDGGGSTQNWVRDQPEYSIRGVTPVHNFLVVKPK